MDIFRIANIKIILHLNKMHLANYYLYYYYFIKLPYIQVFLLFILTFNHSFNHCNCLDFILY